MALNNEHGKTSVAKASLPAGGKNPYPGHQNVAKIQPKTLSSGKMGSHPLVQLGTRRGNHNVGSAVKRGSGFANKANGC